MTRDCFAHQWRMLGFHLVDDDLFVEYRLPTAEGFVETRRADPELPRVTSIIAHHDVCWKSFGVRPALPGDPAWPRAADEWRALRRAPSPQAVRRVLARITARGIPRAVAVLMACITARVADRALLAEYLDHGVAGEDVCAAAWWHASLAPCLADYALQELVAPFRDTPTPRVRGTIAEGGYAVALLMAVQDVEPQWWIPHAGQLRTLAARLWRSRASWLSHGFTRRERAWAMAVALWPGLPVNVLAALRQAPGAPARSKPIQRWLTQRLLQHPASTLAHWRACVDVPADRAQYSASRRAPDGETMSQSPEFLAYDAAWEMLNLSDALLLRPGYLEIAEGFWRRWFERPVPDIDESWQTLRTDDGRLARFAHPRLAASSWWRVFVATHRADALLDWFEDYPELVAPLDRGVVIQLLMHEEDTIRQRAFAHLARGAGALDAVEPHVSVRGRGER